MKNSFLAHVFSGQPEQGPEKSLTEFQRFVAWKALCDQIVAAPVPLQSSDFTVDDMDRDSRVSLSKLSNWELICQEILDTEFSPVYYQKCYAELGRRGKSEQDVLEMQRVAWYTAGWLNFPMMLWDWAHLDESDMFRAIELLHDKKQISQEERIAFENFVKLHQERN